jgi:hypothetical protein
MPKWFVVVRKDTGEAVSYGSVVADQEILEARGLEAIELGDESPDLGKVRWDPKTRQHVPLVQIDRVEEFLNDPDVSAALGGPGARSPVRALFADKLAALLGPERYRVDTDVEPR